MSEDTPTENRPEPSFLKRLLETRVVQTLAVYVPVAWFCNEFLAYATESFGFPQWIAGAAMALFIASIPVVAFLAWVFQVTEEGIKTEVASWQGGLAITLAGSLLLGGSYYLFANLDINSQQADRSLATAQPQRESYQLGDSFESSVAVLPFASLASGDDEDYLSEGISEEIRHALTNVEGLRVASRLSSILVGSRQDNIQAVGQELGVDSVLEGTVQLSGSQLRVTVQLTDVAEGYQIWSERYDRELTNIFDIQDSISRNIVETLQLTLNGPIDALSSDRHPANIEAYELYLRGRYHAGNYDEPELRKAIDYYQQALQAQPNYALAYAGLADVYGSLDYFGHVLPVTVQDEIRDSVDRALALDSKLSDAHFSSARLLFNTERDPEAAELGFTKALELDPTDAWKHGLYAIFLSTQGRSAEAAYEASLSQQLDPLSVRENLTPGWVAFFAGDYERSLQIGVNTLSLDPGFVNTLELIAYSQFHLGNHGDAIETLETASQLADFPIVMGNLGFMYGVVGRTEEARGILADLLARSQREYIPASPIAFVFNGLGDYQQADNWMNRAIANREGSLSILNVVAFDQIRANPNFPNWLQQIGLPLLSE
jgi:serine/threonine-protein kinase